MVFTLFNRIKLNFNPFLCLIFILISISCSKLNSNEKSVKILNEAFDNDIELNENEEKVNIKFNLLKESFLEEVNKSKFKYFNHTFEESRSLIDSAKLYAFFKKMPKGGLLHCHSIGVTNMNWVIDKLQTYPNCFVYTLADNRKYLFGQFMIFNTSEVPYGFVNLNKIVTTDPEFRKKLYEAHVLKRLKLDDNLDYWPEFEKRFLRMGNVTNYRPFFYEYYKKGFTDIINDNVNIIELRYIFNPLFDDAGNVFSADTTVEDFKKIAKYLQRTHPYFQLTLIYTSLKFLNIDKVKKHYASAYALRKKYPEMITGFDLVAEEDAGHSVSYFKPVWALTDSLNSAYGIDMPFFMHAGESNSIANQNVAETINMLYNKRIGHGLNIALFPEVLDQIKFRKMLVEVNPISNLTLGYVSDLRNHPARIMLNNGIQCAISSDDPGVFGYEGLSYDFFMSSLAWELDLKAIKKLVFNSVNYSSLVPKEKKEALKVLQSDWDKFIISLLEK